jgi:signal transduction histidine kinase
MEPNRPLDLWVHGLLSYLRPLDLYRSACDVSQLIEDALSALEPQRAAKEVEITLQLAPLPRLAADPLWLGQAFLAILTNALDTSTHRQCVAIASAANEAFVSVFIASGIQEASQALLVKASGQTELGRSERIGLGLTMAQRIVEAHHGHMALYRRAAHDAMVTVHLPLLSTPLRP